MIKSNGYESERNLNMAKSPKTEKRFQTQMQPPSINIEYDPPKINVI